MYLSIIAAWGAVLVGIRRVAAHIGRIAVAQVLDIVAHLPDLLLCEADSTAADSLADTTHRAADTDFAGTVVDKVAVDVVDTTAFVHLSLMPSPRIWRDQLCSRG